MLPLFLDFDKESYKDGIDISKDEFYDLLINKKKFPKTSQPTAEIFEKIFMDAKNANEVLFVIFIANSLSRTYANSCLANEKVDYHHIYIIDSCTRLLVYRFL